MIEDATAVMVPLGVGKTPPGTLIIHILVFKDYIWVLSESRILFKPLLRGFESCCTFHSFS